MPIDYLNRAGWDCEIFNQANISKYNIVVFQKCYTKNDIELACELKASGIKIVFDQCDNHFYNPAQQPELNERVERLQQISQLADTITVSTAEMAKLFAGKTTIVIDDAIDVPKISWSQKIKLQVKNKLSFSNNNILKVVWFGSAGSETPRFGMIDILKVLPHLENIHLHVMPVKLSVISNSKALFHKYLGNARIDCTYYEWQRETVSYLIKQNDVTIIPVNFNPFTNVKSNNRIVASLMNDVPVIADCIPSYSEFSDFVCFTDWEKCLINHAKSKGQWNEQIKNGKKYIKNKFSEEKIRQAWESVFYSLVK